MFVFLCLFFCGVVAGVVCCFVVVCVFCFLLNINESVVCGTLLFDLGREMHDRVLRAILLIESYTENYMTVPLLTFVVVELYQTMRGLCVSRSNNNA